jgi:hypothetical protein
VKNDTRFLASRRNNTEDKHHINHIKENSTHRKSFFAQAKEAL